MVNKPVSEGRICRWLLLFKEFSFEVVVKPGKHKFGSDHLSRLESGESAGPVDDQLLDAELLKIEAVPDYLEDIALFFTTGMAPDNFTAAQKRPFEMVVRAADYQLIAGQLYKLGFMVFSAGVYLITNSYILCVNAIREWREYMLEARLLL